MVSTPKIIGLMSCGFLLCLGLSTPALAADGTHQEQKGGPRVGGQSGKPDAGQALGPEAGKANPPHQEQKGGPRVGGQSGQPDEVPAAEELEKAHPSHQEQPGGPRVGGQGGQP